MFDSNLSFNNSIYLSESETADRNQGLAYMMQEKKAFQHGKDKAIAARINRTWNNQALRNSLELYFKQCSIECSMLGCGLMAATLANAGVNPWSEERVFSISTVQSMLKIMLTCGM